MQPFSSSQSQLQHKPNEYVDFSQLFRKKEEVKNLRIVKKVLLASQRVRSLSNFRGLNSGSEVASSNSRLPSVSSREQFDQVPEEVPEDQ